eukprot:TRINITY_DN8636_c0_g1_i9.p1 TRINITY_DN8636_c0_g1~~TRINITY_DN8636_c0_g1_i9.p1  ORF type:complete len:100 (-),score=8.00 TRINITY_DN8636_c0_g1_i9:43-342(-)
MLNGIFLGRISNPFNLLSIISSSVSFIFQINPILMNVIYVAPKHGITAALQTKNGNYFSDKEVLEDRKRFSTQGGEQSGEKNSAVPLATNIIHPGSQSK